MLKFLKTIIIFEISIQKFLKYKFSRNFGIGSAFSKGPGSGLSYVWVRARGNFIKYTMRIYDDKVYTNFLSLNVTEDDKECESFTIIPIDSFLVYESKYEL